MKINVNVEVDVHEKVRQKTSKSWQITTSKSWQITTSKSWQRPQILAHKIWRKRLFKTAFFGSLFYRVSKVRKGGGTCFFPKIDREVKGPQMTTGSYEMHFSAGKRENEM